MYVVVHESPKKHETQKTNWGILIDIQIRKKGPSIKTNFWKMSVMLTEFHQILKQRPCLFIQERIYEVRISVSLMFSVTPCTLSSEWVPKNKFNIFYFFNFKRIKMFSNLFYVNMPNQNLVLVPCKYLSRNILVETTTFYSNGVDSTELIFA